MTNERCVYPKCRTQSPIELSYYGKLLCAKHWNKIAAMPVEKAKALLNIREKKDEVADTVL